MCKLIVLYNDYRNFSIYEELRISKQDFLAGFLSQLAQGKPIDECVRCGHYAANHVIQQSGVTLTDLPSFSWSFETATLFQAL